MKKLLLLVLMPFMLVTNSLMAEDALQYCNDLYPSDVYDGEERNNLVQECLVSYGASQEAASSGDDSEYYNGTVDEYVNELPVDSN